jgi:very-short-patch-repair endonuclease
MKTYSAMHISDLDTATRRRLLPDLQDVRAPKKSRKDEAELEFAFQCRAHRLPMFRREHKFAAESHGRGWMLDFAWLDWKVGLEVEGLVVTRVRGELAVSGRHVHPVGFREDCVKYATAALLGWSVLRFEQTQISNGTAIDYTVQLLRACGWRP